MSRNRINYENDFVLNNQKVGIGTTNPTSKLSVIGDSNFIGIITAISFSGSGTNLTSINASNLSSGTVPDARLSGTYTGINVNTTGVITATSFSGSGTNLTSLNATQLTTGTVPDARLSGIYTGFTINTAGVITATSFSGSGANLTTLNASNLSSGTVPDARLSGTYTGISVNTAGVITATSFSGSGTNLTALNASNLSSGTLNVARLPLIITSNINVTSGVSTLNQISVGGTTGTEFYVLSSTGNGMSWRSITAIGSGVLNGINVREEGDPVGTSGSVTTLDFRGNNITAIAATNGSISTITASDTPTFITLNCLGISTASRFISTVTSGTSPLTVASTTLVSNLNADLLDNQHGSYYNDLTNATGILSIERGGTNNSTIPTSGGIVYGTGIAYTFTPSGNAGQFLISNGTSAPTWGASNIEILDDITTDDTRYLLFDNINSGFTTQVNVSSSKLQFNPSSGTLSANIFTSLSDKTQKTNIEPIINAIDTTKKLNGVTFKWKDNNKPSLGLIAQEVEKIIPEVVNSDNEGIKSINYGSLIGLLVEAIKEQQVRIEELERKLNA